MLRVKTCNKFYYEPDSDGLELAGMNLWLKHLGKIPGPLLAYAFDEWEATKTHRPSPAHILGIARSYRSRLAVEAQRAEREEMPFEVPKLTPEQLAQRAEVSEALMRMFKSPVQVSENAMDGHKAERTEQGDAA